MSTSSNQAASLPKAILYWNPTSVWSTVPKLALCEMDYSPEVISLTTVDISKGDNFSAAYLKINHHATIPTLVVPILDSISDDIATTRYKSFDDTISILAYLDTARPSGQGRRLSPATVEGQALSDSLTLAVHLSTADPNFLLVAARTPHELGQKEAGFPGRWIKMRQEALARFVAAEVDGPNRTFLQKKLEANDILYNIYFSPPSAQMDESRRLFFAASLDAWSLGVAGVLKTLEEDMVGPYALGDEVSLADLHIIAWLSRLVFLSLGGPNLEGMSAVEKQIRANGSDGVASTSEHFRVGLKVKWYWNEWLKRPSFKEVYIFESR